MQRKLAVASSFNAHGVNDRKSGAAEHLIFLIGKGNRRRDDNGVASVHPTGSKFSILHTVITLPAESRAFKFNFLPAGDAFFWDLVDGGLAQAIPTIS